MPILSKDKSDNNRKNKLPEKRNYTEYNEYYCLINLIK